MIVREIFAQWINRFLRGIEDESYFFMFYRVNRTGKIYGTLFILRERCITCAMFCQIENIQAESWSGSKVTRQRRWISNSTDSTTREIPPLVKYSKHRTKLPRKQLGKSTIEERRHKKSIRYIIEYLEIDTKPKHRVSVRKIIAIPSPFDRSRENLEPRSEQTSTVEDQVDFTRRFLLLSMENWKKIHGPIRSTTDWLSIPSSYLLRQLESKKKGMKKKKKEYKEEKGKRSTLLWTISSLGTNWISSELEGEEREKGLHRERARVKEARLIFIPDAAPEGTVFLLDAEGLGYRGGLSRRGEESEAERRGRWISEGMEREAKGVATPEESSKCFSTYPRRGTVYRLGECAVSVCCFAFRPPEDREWLGTNRRSFFEFVRRAPAKLLCRFIIESAIFEICLWCLENTCSHSALNEVNWNDADQNLLSKKFWKSLKSDSEICTFLLSKYF